MPVDPKKPRKILVVHGVQSGTDADIQCHKDLEELILNRLNGMPVKFETDIYKYENINDESKEKLFKVFDIFLKQIVSKIPLGGILESVFDTVMDVVVKIIDGSTAMTIRDGLIEEIEKVFEEGYPLYIVAHSLGSVYAFDAVNKLIKGENEYFDRTKRRTWPVQALVTLGSPIGLSMFERDNVERLGPGNKFFRWINYWARTDPVVSGSFYGKPLEGYEIAERFAIDSEDCGWWIRDRIVDTGAAWLMAHTAYWNHAGMGDELVTLITS